jgi:DNA-binding CsgD family transcriptional regulator
MEEALAVCRRRAGGLHDPELVNLLSRTERKIGERLRSGDAWALVLAAEPRPHQILESRALDRACAAIGAFADMKSSFTAGRSGRVAVAAVAAGRHLGLSASALGRLRRAALVHDVGRVAVTSAIWDRPGRLSVLQQEQVRLFPLHGERILSHASGLRSEAALVGLQREALDGSGYPRGVGAAAIPLEARVLGTASAYVAMREQRAWRPAHAHEAAVAELRSDVRALRADSHVVDAVAEADAPRSRGRPRIDALSDREVEVLRLLAAGHTNHDIGRRLTISSRTAEHHVRSVYDKLGVRSRAAATLWAARAGLTMIRVAP